MAAWASSWVAKSTSTCPLKEPFEYSIQTLTGLRGIKNCFTSLSFAAYGRPLMCTLWPVVDIIPILPPPPPPKKHGETPVCDLCAKAFATQKTLKGHRQTVHRQSDGFSCRVCDRRSYRKDILRKHHLRKHGDEEYEAPASHACPIYQKSFHYRSHLKEHLKTHRATATTLSPPTSPVSPLAPPASALHSEPRACRRREKTNRSTFTFLNQSGTVSLYMCLDFWEWWQIWDKTFSPACRR